MRKPQTREGQLSELPGTLSEKWPSFRDLLPRVREPQAATYSIQAKVKLGPTRSWTQRSVGTSACFAADLFISQGSEFCRLVIPQAVAQKADKAAKAEQTSKECCPAQGACSARLL